MGPSVADSSTVLCKPAYGGNVYLYYSVDGGAVWETLTILETFAFRAEEFTEVTHGTLLSLHLSYGALARLSSPPQGRAFALCFFGLPSFGRYCEDDLVVHHDALNDYIYVLLMVLVCVQKFYCTTSFSLLELHTTTTIFFLNSLSLELGSQNLTVNDEQISKN